MEDATLPTKKLRTESKCSESGLTDENKIGVECDLISNKTSFSLPDQLLEIETRYCDLLSSLTFDNPVTHVYNPMKYANIRSQFVQKYCRSEKPILFLSMNPGPWGMSQPGVPFGDDKLVQDWFKLSDEVVKPDPANLHTTISGVSSERFKFGGNQFWSVLREIFGNDPEDVLRNCFVHNYCPLSFVGDSGTNITPVDLRGHQKQELLQLCDDLLVEVLLLLNVKGVIAIGRFAEAQIKNVVKKAALVSLKLTSIVHPSLSYGVPRTKGWKKTAKETIEQFIETLS